MTRSPTKGRAPRMTLADLRPNSTIQCFYCNQVKPQTGSQKFHAHHVCGECVGKLQKGGGK